MILHLKDENFQEVVSKNLVLVDFFATWCGPCKMLGPVLEEVSKTHPDLTIIKVDVDEHEDLAREYAVMSVPTILLFQNGQVIKKQVGFLPREVIEEWLEVS